MLVIAIDREPGNVRAEKPPLRRMALRRLQETDEEREEADLLSKAESLLSKAGSDVDTIGPCSHAECHALGYDDADCAGAYVVMVKKSDDADCAMAYVVIAKRYDDFDCVTAKRYMTTTSTVLWPIWLSPKGTMTSTV